MALVSDSWNGLLVDGQPQDPVVIDDALEALRTGVNAIDNNNIIAFANITGSKLASGTITDLQLAAGSVGSSELQTDAVTEDKILNGAVTSGKLGTLSILDTSLNWSGGGSEVSALRAWSSQQHVLFGTHAVSAFQIGTTLGSGISGTGTIDFTTAINYDATHTFANAANVSVVATPLWASAAGDQFISVTLNVISGVSCTYRIAGMDSSGTTAVTTCKLQWMAIGDWA